MQGPSGLARPRFQLDAYAKSADLACALADLVKDHLDGFSGMMGDVAVQGASSTLSATTTRPTPSCTE